MNTKEFLTLNDNIIPKVQSKLDKLGDGNVIVQLRSMRSNTTTYGISAVDGNAPYEAYELYNDGNSASWKFLGMTR